jgi:murein DD-endopeptidase MepM/ murein hydrolase activator NlpD
VQSRVLSKSNRKRNKKNHWYSKLIARYRLILLNERTYEERLAVNISLLQIVLIILGLCLFVSAFVAVLFMYTPVKELVPGYVEDKWRKDAYYSRRRVDSLLSISAEKDRYMKNLKVLLEGGVVRDSMQTAVDRENTSFGEELSGFSTAPEDSALRARISEEDRYLLNMTPSTEEASSASKLLLFQPLTGMVSSEYNPKINHFGIDIVAPANSVIKSVLEGTVILASWTSDGGNVIQVQHPHNLISIYKHNSVLLKKQGDKIEAGDAIAIIGDSGDHSDGPHLHFELWNDGSPVNPAQYIVFDDN